MNLEQKINSSMNNWEKVTPIFDEATKEMKLGEMIYPEEFNLFEAMSALEIMDPKMDSGMMLPEVGQIYTLEEKIEMKLVPDAANLTNIEILQIIDYLLGCEVMLYQGFSFIQTIFTCIYLQDISLLNNNFYLLIYMKTLLRTINLIRINIMKADVYEEEDFISHTFGFNLHEQISDQDLSRQLKQVEDQLQKKISESNNPEKKHYESLLLRIQFRKTFYNIIINLDKSQCRGTETSRKFISTALNQLNMIKDTHKIELNKDKNFIIEKIFEPNVSRRLHLPTPFRALKIIDIFKAIDEFQKMLKFFDLICYWLLPFSNMNPINPTLSLSLQDLPQQYTFSECQQFFKIFSYNIPDIVSRSKLINMFLGNDRKLFGRYPFSFIIRQSMINFGIPSKFLLENESSTNPFIEKISEIFTQIFCIFSLNRTRQRRKLGKILEDIGNLQNEAEEIDNLISSKLSNENHFFSSWVIEQTLFIMIQYLQLGFELNLYSENEYLSIYWYLDYLYEIFQQNRAYIQNIQQNEKSEKKKKKKEKKKIKIEPQQQYILEAYLNICRGILRLLCGINLFLEKIYNNETNHNPLQKKFPLGTDEMRFYYRFFPFHKLQQPTPLLYSHFIETITLSKLQPEKLIEGSKECFQQGKNHIEKLLHLIPQQNQQHPLETLYIHEWKSLAKVCIGNLVQVQLISALKPSNQLKCYFDFSFHKYFPIISLK